VRIGCFCDVCFVCGWNVVVCVLWEVWWGYMFVLVGGVGGEGEDWFRLVHNIYMTLPTTVTPFFYFPLNLLPKNIILGWKNIGGGENFPPPPQCYACTSSHER